MKQRALVIITLALFLIVGCSVHMAAKKEGTAVEEVMECKTESCLLAKGCELLDSSRTKEGDLVNTYKFLQKRGSAGRAVMHGVLDVMTLGLWEVAGTPMEGSKEKQYTTIKVLLDEEKNIKKIELI